MHIDSIVAWSVYGLYVPSLAIVLILVHFAVRRVLWRRRKRSGRGPFGFYPSALALSMAFQFIQVYHRPSVAYVLEARRDAQEDADADDSGDPESRSGKVHLFKRQLRKIRSGEGIDCLVWRR